MDRTDIPSSGHQIDADTLASAMELVYTFVMESHDNYLTARDYGTGEKINMVEIHILTLIADHPGIISSEVARMWNRTRSAATQNINRLCQKGWVEKRRDAQNRRYLRLYATPEGQRLSDLHKAYDHREMLRVSQELSLRFSVEQLASALEILKAGLAIIEQDTREKQR